MTNKIHYLIELHSINLMYKILEKLKCQGSIRSFLVNPESKINILLFILKYEYQKFLECLSFEVVYLYS